MIVPGFVPEQGAQRRVSLSTATIRCDLQLRGVFYGQHGDSVWVEKPPLVEEPIRWFSPP
jgi:hypothetical protein